MSEIEELRQQLATATQERDAAVEARNTLYVDNNRLLDNAVRNGQRLIEATQRAKSLRVVLDGLLDVVDNADDFADLHYKRCPKRYHTDRECDCGADRQIADARAALNDATPPVTCEHKRMWMTEMKQSAIPGHWYSPAQEVYGEKISRAVFCVDCGSPYAEKEKGNDEASL